MSSTRVACALCGIAGVCSWPHHLPISAFSNIPNQFYSGFLSRQVLHLDFRIYVVAYSFIVFMEKSQIRHYLIFLVVAEFEIGEELTPLPSYRGIHTLASSFWILTEFVVI